MAPALGADSLTGPLVLKSAREFLRRRCNGTHRCDDRDTGWLPVSQSGRHPSQPDVCSVPDSGRGRAACPGRPAARLLSLGEDVGDYAGWPDGLGEYFVRKHHAVYIPDQSSRARSGFDATTINEVRLGTQPPSALPNIFTFGRNGAWQLFRFGPAYPAVFFG